MKFDSCKITVDRHSMERMKEVSCRTTLLLSRYAERCGVTACKFEDSLASKSDEANETIEFLFELGHSLEFIADALDSQEISLRRFLAEGYEGCKARR